MVSATSSPTQQYPSSPLGLEERLALLAEASRVLADASLEAPAVLERFCALVVPLLGQACGVRLLSEDGQWLNPVATAHSDPSSREAFKALTSEPQRTDEGLSALVVKKGESLLLSALPPEVLRRAVAPSLKAAAERFPFSDLIVLPLRARGRIFGTLAVARGLGRRPFEDTERLLLQEVADRAAVVLDVARAYAAERQARQDAEVSANRILRMQRATAALSEALTPADVAGVAMREAMDAVGADQGFFAVSSEDPTWLELLGSRNLPTGSVERLARFPSSAPLSTAEAYRTGKSMWLETREELAAHFPATVQRPEISTQAVASLPLLARGRALGALTLGFLSPRTFTPDERAFLKDLVGQTAQAMERARLYAAEQQARANAQRAAERTTRLQAVTAELSQALTATRVAEIVVDHGVKAVGARSGGLWLIEPDGAYARLVRTVGYPQELVERFQRLPLQMGAPLMEAMREGRPMWMETPEAVARPYPVLEERQGAPSFTQTPSMACLPLKAEGRTLGALVLGFTEPRRFDADERAFLELLVHPAAEALARARLLEQQQLAQAALREAHQTLSALIQASPAAILLMDRDGTVRLWNSAAETIFGWTAEEAIGHTLVAVPENRQTEFRDNLERAARGEPLMGLETQRQRKDGSVIDVALWASAVRQASGQVQCIYVVTDITERKRAEDSQRFLARAGSELASSLDDEATLERVARLAVPSWADACSIYLQEEDEPRCVASAHVDDAPEPSSRDAELAAVRRILASSMPELRREFSPRPQASLRVPLVVRGQALGVLSLTTTRRIYDTQDLALAQELARQAALAIDNARLYHEAQQAVRLREEFLSIASHELKTPISALQLQVQILLSTLARSPSGPSPERLRRSLETVDRQVHRQTQLVNDLLDVSRISAGRLQLQPENMELSALAREVAERFEPELARAGSALLLQLSAETAGQWDKLRLDQVVTNLLSNAVKYGRGNPIQLVTETTSDRVRLSVKDGGIGIAQEDLTRLFNRFERAVSERNYGGFGLGLWISRQIVEAMGGRIQVTSQPGVGSTFTVELPRQRD
ncbi:sensor histidine kinase [Hyalangium versicolor]|uniref:sensor histidine kinase n=1 Tax=Hyalangium versicolor TaxID=2861190 RepID=UPI001CCF5EED|nr:GAF domain-containing protein [Hyalangium versicolor]